MLVKQTRRLETKSDKTLSVLLKHKYCKRSSLFGAPVGTQSSFSWKSICEARSVLQLGLRWKIGKGNQVLLAMIHGCSAPSTFRIALAPRSLRLEEKVARLLRANGITWNDELIHEDFSMTDVEEILKVDIPLEDSCPVENPTICMEGLYGRHPSEQQPLETRGVGADRVWCPHEESVLHVLLRCTFAHQVWSLSHLPWHSISHADGGMKVWLRWNKAHLDT
ncbi:hypothetical protein Salat_1164300 [Sesamum alatum]|uniref:Reverse transcriptase zinc-binding domain-containing protein n=1 Tax=Sesamum alatum TaxID=300844 RepID=A0AAE2CNG7_9LAMI|nr:hypothetical protein Salat_1164300 [Sesamum alatum]